MKDRDVIYGLYPAWNQKTVRITRAGGQTNRNYIVEHGADAFFVRLPWESGVIDRTVEGKNILTLSNSRNLAPLVPAYKIYVLEGKNILASHDSAAFDVPDGTAVTPYIAGREFTLRDFRQKTRQKSLASALYAFHASGVRFANNYDVFRDEIEKYRREARRHSLAELANKETITALVRAEKKAKSELRPTQRGIPTHNDVIFQNVLLGRGGKVHLLDFEYAGMNKRGGAHYDFGFLFADNLFRRPRMSKELFEEFLSVADKVYKKKLDRTQIYAATQAVVVMQFWWAVLRYFAVHTKKEKQYFAAYAQARARKIQE